MPEHKPYKILITGGGTGGHVFPAIAIANALKARDAQTEFLFVGANGKLEMQKVPEAGYHIEGLDIAGFQRGSVMKNIGLPFKILRSLLRANKLVKQFNPDVTVGVGGYASGPTMWVAERRKVPVLIQEQNSFAGVTNKLMAKKALKFCVAYDDMERFFPAERIVKTGNPVRSEIVQREVSREEALQHFGLNTGMKTILVIGGSLGARTINESIQKDLEKLNASGHQVLWQTGRIYFKAVEEATQGFENIHAREFIQRMDMAYEAADLIISRAGAISISELCVVGKPVILVPSPNVAEDHQTKNAQALEEAGAAVMITDANAGEQLVSRALKLINDNARQKILSENIKVLAIPDAADRIADEVLNLIPRA